MLFIVGYIILSYLTTETVSHIPDYVTTPSNKQDQYCMLAENCFHDTIPVCGKYNDQTRTFLDFCDLLEYACDTTQAFVHVEDVAGCPPSPPTD